MSNNSKGDKPALSPVASAVNTTTLDDLCKSLILDTTKIHDYLMSLSTAEELDNALKTMRKYGGACRSLAGHEKVFFVALYGFTPSCGDEPAKCRNFRNAEIKAQYMGMDYAKALKKFADSSLKDYTPKAKPKAKKEKDAKASNLEIIGSWDEGLIAFIAANQSKIEDLRKTEKA